MSDSLQDMARVDLRITPVGGPEDWIIWEHSRRVATLARFIAACPELAGRDFDLEVLEVAGLYHDAGWALKYRQGELGVDDLLLKPTPDSYRDLAADWIESRLAEVVAPGVLQQAARAIRTCNNRRADLLDARVLAEAENLDEIGPQQFCLMLRKQRAEGKTLENLLATWQRQEEYHYWTARIDKGFQFPSVRALAERRLQMMRRFMADLQATIHFEDLRSLSGASSENTDIVEKRK